MTGQGDRINPKGRRPEGFIRSPRPVMSSYIPSQRGEAQGVRTLFCVYNKDIEFHRNIIV